MKTFEQAIHLLQSPTTWCEGAEALAQLGDRRGVLPLLRAFELPIEGVDKLCLAEALRTLAGDDTVRQLTESQDPDERRAAARLMRLFAHERHLPQLEQAVTDPSADVRHEARRAIAAQPQSLRWERAVARMLTAPDEETRAQAIESLGARRSQSAADALRSHAPRESSPELRLRLERALGGPR